MDCKLCCLVFIITIMAKEILTEVDFFKNVDLKKRTEAVDTNILQQKDFLLNMLENKLKELKNDKKKKRTDTETRCEFMPKDVNLRLKSNGLSAVGESDVQLKFGNSGKGNLNFESTGISNFGKALLNLGVNGGGLNLPGINDLFIGRDLLKYDCQLRQSVHTADVTQQPPDEPEQVQYRRKELDTTVQSVNVTSVEKQENVTTLLVGDVNENATETNQTIELVQTTDELVVSPLTNSNNVTLLVNLNATALT